MKFGQTSSSSPFIGDNFIYMINESLRSSLPNTMNLIRVLLTSLKKAQCLILFDRISEFLLEKSETFRYTQYFAAALDILKSKIGKPLIPSTANKRPLANYCHIKFSNKAIDFIQHHSRGQYEDTARYVMDT